MGIQKSAPHVGCSAAPCLLHPPAKSSTLGPCDPPCLPQLVWFAPRAPHLSHVCLLSCWGAPVSPCATSAPETESKDLWKGDMET